MSKAELLERARPIIRERGAAWLVPIIDRYHVERISDLPAYVLRAIVDGWKLD